jgi:hypothetical protein
MGDRPRAFAGLGGALAARTRVAVGLHGVARRRAAFWSRERPTCQGS